MGASNGADYRAAGRVSAGKRKGEKIDWLREIGSFATLVLAILFVHSAIAKPFYIPSESMLPGLMTGDHLIVSKFPYGYSYLSPSVRLLPHMEGRLFGRMPERGDVVVLKSPATLEDYIKRVIGLPGDTVQMRDGLLYLNGVVVPREPMAPAEIVVSPNTDCRDFPQYRAVRADGTAVCRYPRYRETLPNGRSYETLDLIQGSSRDNTEIYRVPEGHVFLLGDNRDNSADSRVHPAVGGLGFLPIENIVGRAEFITFSLDGSGKFYDPRSWLAMLRTDRAWASLHPETKAK